MFKNDERYWDINLLNKWFAISSIVFLLVLVWIFIEDNDDELQSRIILHESVTGFHNGELDHPVHVRWNRRTL